MIFTIRQHFVSTYIKCHKTTQLPVMQEAQTLRRFSYAVVEMSKYGIFSLIPKLLISTYACLSAMIYISCNSCPLLFLSKGLWQSYC